MLYKLAKIKGFNKIILSISSIILLFNGGKRRSFRQKIKKIYQNHQKQQLAQLIMEKYSDSYCIFSRYGIGDIFFIASLLKEFKKRNRKKIVYFTEKKRLIKFLKAFTSIDEVVFSKELKFVQEEQNLQQALKIGKLNKLFFPYRGNKDTYTFSDNYNNLLGLPLDTERDLPIISKENSIIALREFEKLNVAPERTILIIPDATMFDYRIIDSTFWINLAEEIKSLGYNVVFNCKMTEYKNYKNTFLPIMDFVAFAQKVHYVISVRSGIDDLLVGINMSNISVIYPPNLEVIWADATGFNELHKHHIRKFENEFDNIFNIHSLNSNFKRNDIHEIIYDYNDISLIKEILQNIKKENIQYE